MEHGHQPGKNIDPGIRFSAEHGIKIMLRAAAAELRSKIASELSRLLAENSGNQHLKRQLLAVYRADIKTVDAFCTALLRENTHLLPREGDKHALTPDFRVLDEGDAQLIRQRILDRVMEQFYEEMDDGGRLLADTLGAGRDDRGLTELVLEVHQSCRATPIRIAGWRRAAASGRRWQRTSMRRSTPGSCWM